MDQHSQIYLTHISKDNECGNSARREIVGTDRSAELTLKPTCLSLCLNLDRFGAKTRNSAEYGDYSRRSLRRNNFFLLAVREKTHYYLRDGGLSPPANSGGFKMAEKQGIPTTPV